MADAEYGEYGAYAPATGRGQRIINIAGALGSVALVVSLGWWGWELAMRDAHGVPVIRAMEGAMRIAPEDPGGTVMDHQGLSVNDVAAEGGAAPPADRLVLAPKPVELTLEDAPGLAASLPPGDATPAGADVSARSDTPALVPPVAQGTDTDDAVAAALAEALGTDISDIPEAAALDDNGEPPPPGAITRSPRPMPRPGAARTARAAAPVARPVPVDAATLAPGTRLVQFGAYDTPEQAEEQWMRIAGQFSALIEGKQMVVQSAESGGRTFWRLRATGFEGEDDSRRFCAALEAENTKCIPVVHR